MNREGAQDAKADAKKTCNVGILSTWLFVIKNWVLSVLQPSECCAQSLKLRVFLRVLRAFAVRYFQFKEISHELVG